MAGLAFVGFAVAAHGMPYFPFDPPISRAVQAVDAPWLHPLAAAASWIGFPPQVNVLVGLLVLGLWLVRRPWEAAAVALAGAGAGGLYLLVQALVGQPRPTADLVRVAANLPSSAFPSGHETTFTAVLGVFAYLGYTNARRALARWLSVLAAVAGLLVMGWARVFQGEHWASDILGGCFLGCLWLALTIHLYRWARQRYTPPCRSPSDSSS